MDASSHNNVEDAVLRVLLEGENLIDEELRAINNIQNDDKELNILREKRLEEIKKEAEEMNRYKQCGHGKYDLISDEREFFEVIKKSKDVICHFFRPTTRRCEIFDEHLRILSGKHLEARFIKMNAEKSHFICNHLNVRILPTIALIKNSKLVHKIVGFEELSSRDDFRTVQLENLLIRKGSLQS
ncbi:Thioredoxin domain-containing protein 9 [Cryptosporidium felis]|nr:Thioredoxin domain-containing protein 9 [Cryptosporidium felis]